MEALPGNCHEVRAKTGLAKTTVWRWLTELHADGACHITGWHRTENGGPYTATYSPGPGVDVKCKIKPYSDAVKSRRHMKKAKADGRWMDRQARERAMYWADRALKVRDPMIEAFFGPAKRPTPTLETA